MPVPGYPWDDILEPYLGTVRSLLGPGTSLLDVHTHTGFNDPDGVKGSVEDLLGGLDRAGIDEAVVFTTAEPEGYPPANDRVLAEIATAGGRLRAFARIDPNAGDPLPEARRCLEAGAVGFKLHPRSDAFVMSHPSVQALVELAAAERLPVLVHAGRGIPALGEDLVTLARRHPSAALILAHAGISDLGLVGPVANELQNLYFDTSWWLSSDMLALFETVDPSRILFASDMPYGSGRYALMAFVRCAREVGLGPDALEAIAGGNARRVLAGEPPIDLGGPPGRGVLGHRWLAGERVIAYTAAACQMIFRFVDATEPLALARLACQIPTGGADGDEARLLTEIDGLLETAQAVQAQEPLETRAARFAAIAAQLLAGTPRVPI
ncbi:amidohydrolase family protein [Capillimicrobium parvum]|uniref:amidohydrolase family protein n=1 Tax=Capillimicrobium parvum TaxID=2884022 RepID=UPI00216AF116|nr:amidohydrolase family protein [Capillimicrobium parvum]